MGSLPPKGGSRIGCPDEQKGVERSTGNASLMGHESKLNWTVRKVGDCCFKADRQKPGANRATKHEGWITLPMREHGKEGKQ